MNKITIGKDCSSAGVPLSNVQEGTVFMNESRKQWCIKIYSSDNLLRWASLNTGATFSCLPSQEKTVTLLRKTLHLEPPK